MWLYIGRFPDEEKLIKSDFVMLIFLLFKLKTIYVIALYVYAYEFFGFG